MQHAGRAVVFSGLTVAIGLLSMIVLPVPMLRSVGYGGVLVPLGLPVAVAIPRLLYRSSLASRSGRGGLPSERLRAEPEGIARLFSAWASLVYRHKWVAAVVGLGIAGARLPWHTETLISCTWASRGTARRGDRRPAHWRSTTATSGGRSVQVCITCRRGADLGFGRAVGGGGGGGSERRVRVHRSWYAGLHAGRGPRHRLPSCRSVESSVTAHRAGRRSLTV